ncbi:MAG: GNAT family N-acetyltransferase [Candidatus Micrarchaeota archaeon]
MIQLRRERPLDKARIGTELMWPPRADRASMLDRVSGKVIENGNDRLRAFAPAVLNKRNSEGIMRQAREAGEREEVSRITMRAVVRPEDAEVVCATAAYAGLPREGQIMMDGRLLVYFGRNSGMRRVSTETSLGQRASASQIMARAPKTEEQLLGIIRANGYVFGDTVNERDFERLVELYGTCLPRYCVTLDSNKLTELFMNPENAFAVIRERGRIIAAAVAEQSIIAISGASLHDVEISECVTDPGHRGKGLMSAIIHRLISSIRMGRDTLIYSESRAGFAPINAAMRNNGMVHSGWLEKAVVIGENGPVEGPGQFEHMESLNVWALQRSS